MNKSLLRPLSRLVVRQPILQPRQHLSTSIISRFADAIIRFLPKRTDLGNARSLLYNCIDQANNRTWYTNGKIETDFRSNQAIIMIHVWMVHRKLITMGRQGQHVQEAMFDLLWDDTSNRIRGKGVNELSVNKYLKDVQGYSFRLCVELDHALSISKPGMDIKTISAILQREMHALETEQTSEDGVLTKDQLEKVVVDEIAGVLRKMVYLQKDDTVLSQEDVLVLARYVRSEQQSLMELPEEAIFESRFEWGPVPTWGKSVPTKENGDAGDWKEAVAPDGKVYYWNTVTRMTKWDKPKGYRSLE
mmetsp:Transcript_61680/g.121378  ORF Transcript_61680/g.121378 Transcript_61680/m.121378 type:complete len:304 (-) Transcript_61680:170-1081(-)